MARFRYATPAQRASRVLSCHGMDMYYPVVSLAAFLSGGCLGFYYAVAMRRARTR